MLNEASFNRGTVSGPRDSNGANLVIGSVPGIISENKLLVRSGVQECTLWKLNQMEEQTVLESAWEAVLEPLV